MNTLVTGATGFIGRQLCIELLKQGHQLIILGRDDLKTFKQRFTLPCTYYSWQAFSQLDSKLDVDHVIHLAGSSIAAGRWTEKRKKIIIDSRVKTTHDLINYFQTHQNWPKTFISASAIGIYGHRGDTALDESSSHGTGFLAEVCRAWENASEPFEQHSRRLLLRFGLVLHPRDGFLKQLQPIFSMGLGGSIGSGKQYMSWVHLKDVIQSILFCINNQSIQGPVNVTAPMTVRNHTFTRLFVQRLKRKALLPVPTIALKLVLGEMSELALNSQNVFPHKLQSHGYDFAFKTLEDALENLYAWQKSANEQRYETEQWFDYPVSDIFSFFCEAKNLESITPPILGFKVLDQSTPSIQTGTLINYKLNIHRIPTRWTTLIEDWQPNHAFVDTQLKGPYKKWHHTHIFQALAHGTLMKDSVIYEIPLGRLGRLCAGFFVFKDIQKIFKFRKSKTQTIFS